MQSLVEAKPQEGESQPLPLDLPSSGNHIPSTSIAPIPADIESTSSAVAPKPLAGVEPAPDIAGEQMQASAEQDDSQLERLEQEFQERLEVYLARPRTSSEPMPAFLSIRGLQEALKKLDKDEEKPGRKRSKRTRSPDDKS